MDSIHSQPHKLLLVEDSPTDMYYIKHVVSALGFQVQTSSCAEQALALIKQHHFDIVISDWCMPGMSGPQLAQQLKTLANPPYIILLTGNNQAKHTVAGIEAGADDFLTKPFNPAILKVRLLAAQRIINQQQCLAEQNQQLARSLDKEQAYLQQLRQELHSASLLQQALLPDNSQNLADWSIASTFDPAQDLAGDIFQCFEIDPSHIGFYLLDVTGHGVAAAMQSFTLAQQLSSPQCPWDGYDPAVIAQSLNDNFSDPEDLGRFATLAIGIANTRTGECRMTNAGHPRAIVLGKQRVSQAPLDNQLPIGIKSGTQYRFNTFTLSPNESLMLFSDGLYECVHPKFGEFGLQRVKRLCQQAITMTPAGLLNHLRHAVNLWQQHNIQDDISMMIISTQTQHAH
ncbi:SpoIIE family protein phosphatase [Shewanella waksmanii]|uniref:SpoIIE family protein phosphatase n=1 Tax=Shewanella waksmanii TaxID=213783 RepID=UPI0004B2EA58|nr:SpoIIE family protein phosphatase [Shewanella waksmanii]